MAPALRAAMIALAVIATACSRRDPVTSCDQPLAGPWRSDHAADERWMILERSGELEIYPLFPDGRPEGSTADIETAPRVIDLRRTPSGITGEIKRRYMRGGVECIAKAPVHVTSCANDVLELVLSDPSPPAGFEPCTAARPDGSRRERWRRE
ncbi:MAG: hypothetical protein H0T42_13005 [Deltaproteobacteria bacterium]|nr:hypothetical protein [Deltaproteobacteria bacterium]